MIVCGLPLVTGRQLAGRCRPTGLNFSTVRSKNEQRGRGRGAGATITTITSGAAGSDFLSNAQVRLVASAASGISRTKSTSVRR